jgi:hypothetical protein
MLPQADSRIVVLATKSQVGLVGQLSSQNPSQLQDNELRIAEYTYVAILQAVIALTAPQHHPTSLDISNLRGLNT